MHWMAHDTCLFLARFAENDSCFIKMISCGLPSSMPTYVYRRSILSILNWHAFLDLHNDYFIIIIIMGINNYKTIP